MFRGKIKGEDGATETYGPFWLQTCLFGRKSRLWQYASTATQNHSLDQRFAVWRPSWEGRESPSLPTSPRDRDDSEWESSKSYEGLQMSRTKFRPVKPPSRGPCARSQRNDDM